MAKKNDSEVPSQQADNEGFIKIQDHRPLYRMEDCQGAPVRGLLLGTQPMNPAKGTNNEPWTALVVKLTRDCPAVQAGGDVQLFTPGTEILVGGVDNASLYRTANDPKNAFEVILTPREAPLKLSGGKKMFIFDKEFHPKPHNRVAEGLIFFTREPLTLAEGPNTGNDDAEPPFGSPG
jgi:hypothetical protein